VCVCVCGVVVCVVCVVSGVCGSVIVNEELVCECVVQRSEQMGDMRLRCVCVCVCVCECGGVCMCVG